MNISISFNHSLSVGGKNQNWFPIDVTVQSDYFWFYKAFFDSLFYIFFIATGSEYSYFSQTDVLYAYSLRSALSYVIHVDLLVTLDNPTVDMVFDKDSLLFSHWQIFNLKEAWKLYSLVTDCSIMCQ